MGLRAAARAGLARLAAGAPPRVFLLVGAGGRDAAEELALDPRLRAVDSPRSANVLLAVGGAVAGLLRPALGVHDQASRPRTTVWWPLSEDEARCRRLARLFDRVAVVGPEEDPAEVVLRCHRGLLAGTRRSDPEVLAGRSGWEPAAWRGVGQHGQGGEGMMGGTPYGRPMAGRAPDRDGLELDRLPLRLGPFFPHLPPGLVLEVKLQGDVFQQVAVERNPFARRSRSEAGRPPAPSGHPFPAVLRRPVPLAHLELARARHHLRWLARALRFHGLPALGDRALRLALGVEDLAAAARAPAVRRLERLLRRTGALRAATRGVGPLRGDAVAGLGPVARAAGRPDDLRGEEESYRDLGFEPVVGEGGDAWARLLQRLREAAQSFDLAARAAAAGDPAVGPLAAVEAPRGRLVPGEPPPAARLLALAPAAIPGLEWGDALALLISLDLDLEEVAPPPRTAVAPIPGERADEGEQDAHEAEHGHGDRELDDGDEDEEAA